MHFYAQVLGGKLGMMTDRHSPFAGKCASEDLDGVVQLDRQWRAN
jgi:hypothetical protein